MQFLSVSPGGVKIVVIKNMVK